jgi:formylglycine-generating enzyme required for sulfatase activity/DNA-binding winged helix-turn-helix (wHTH) protein
MAAKSLQFSSFTLDLERMRVRGPNGDADLRPKSFEVLRYLVEHSGRVVGKEEVIEAIWPDVTVTDESLTRCISDVRRALDDGRQQIIKTVPKRGYLFDVPVWEVPAIARVDVKAATSAPQPSSVRPSEIAEPAPGSETSAMLANYPVTGEKAIECDLPTIQCELPHTQPVRLQALAVALALIGAAAAGTYLLAGSIRPIGGAGKPPESARAAPVPRPTFRDCPVCPEMVELPAGEFMMGSPDHEPSRTQAEGPRRRVVIPKRVALGKFEVTIEQFSAFATQIGFASGNVCHIVVRFDHATDIAWSEQKASFREPGFDVTPAHPAVCISWYEAQAYAAWLGRRTGKPYRLPTEAEWEYSTRAGTTTSYSFGMNETEACAYARFADLNSRYGWRDTCRSGIVERGPLPVGALMPNPWGLFDMHGNAWEWVQDCWTPDVRELPTDGSAFIRSGGCELGVIRGGSFASWVANLRSANRLGWPVAAHDQTIGFRVALPLDP